MDREGRRLRIFQPNRKELAHLEKKNDKKKSNQKVECRSLGKRKIKGQPSRTPQNGKVS